MPQFLTSLIKTNSNLQNFIIFYPEIGENVIFKNNSSKNIKIAIKQDLQVVVRFPKYCSSKKAEEFFRQKILWVSNSLQRMKKKQQIRQKLRQKLTLNLSPEQIIDRQHYIILRTRKLAEIHNFAIKKIILRKQRTIWGSCSSQNNISLNANLALLSDQLIEYVILHELVHTEVKDHSKKFWSRLEQILPNCQFLDQELKIFSPHIIE